MNAALPEACPVCRVRGTVAAHCSASTCDLVRCSNCKGYGTADGMLWRLVA